MRVPIRKPGKYTHTMPDTQMTRGKFLEYQNQLKKLEEQILPMAAEVQRLAVMGDFSENAAYQMAKGRLRYINQKISELKNHLANAIIIKPTNNKTVQIGHRVTITFDNDSKTYLILGSSETDPKKGAISYLSPIGSALIGRKKGDKITIKLEKIGKQYVISNIE